MHVCLRESFYTKFYLSLGGILTKSHHFAPQKLYNKFHKLHKSATVTARRRKATVVKF